MSLTLKRQDLVTQVIAHLRSEIQRGTWRESLPGERELSDLIQVSRTVCRAALAALAEEGLVTRRHGARTEIAERRAATASTTRDVGLLIPHPLGLLRPNIALAIDELRTRLFEVGVSLRIYHGRQFYSSKPESALRRLTRQAHHACWVMALSTEAMQRWFAESKLACVVAGSTYPDIDLPSADIDHRAVCRHAAGQLLRVGHRQLALLTKRTRSAGDIESINGFLEGVQKSGHADALGSVVYLQETRESAGQVVRRLLAQPRPPTGLIVANPYCYLAVVSILTRSGVRIPADVSVISRDDDPFLNFLEPTPARYVSNPQRFAHAIFAQVLLLLERRGHKATAVRMLAKYEPGQSLGPAPGR